MRSSVLVCTLLVAACAQRPSSGGVAGDEGTETAGADDAGTSGGSGETDGGGDGDGDGDGDGPHPEGVPLACKNPPAGLVHAEHIADGPEALAGFAASPFGGAAVTDYALAAGFWSLTVVCPDGTIAWRVELPVSDQAYVSGVSFGPDGDVWVSGGEWVEPSWDRFVARVSRDGDLRWTRVFPGSAHPAVQMAMNPMLSMTTFALDPDWTQAGYAELAIDIDVAANGRAYVTGDVDDAELGNGAWVAELDDQGAVAWEHVSSSPAMCESGLMAALDGDRYVTAGVIGPHCDEGASLELVVSSYANSGELEWATHLDAGEAHRTWRVAAREGMTVVGGSIGVGPDTVPRIIAFDEDGAVVWDLVDPGPNGFVSDVAIDGSGRVFVAGGNLEPELDAWLRAYASDGTLQDTHPLAFMSLIAATPDDTLYALRGFKNSEPQDDGWELIELDL